MRWLFCKMLPRRTSKRASCLKVYSSCHLTWWFLFVPTIVICKLCLYEPPLVSHGESSTFLFALHMEKSILIPSFFRLSVGFNKDLRDSFLPPKKSNPGLVIRLHAVTAHAEEPNKFFIVPRRPINLLLNISLCSYRDRHTQKHTNTQAFL